MTKKTNRGIDIVKRIAGTFYLPVIIFLIIFIIAQQSPTTSFFGLNAQTWQNLVQRWAATATIAFALGIQIKNGRFDFSGGAVMTLGSIVSVTVIQQFVESWILLLILSIIVCAVLSTLVGCLYVYGRLPVIITTIGAAILFESLTLVVNKGRGVGIASNAKLNILGKNIWMCLALMAVCAIVYFIFNNLTVTGQHAKLLSNNQEAAVNIGINERKNVLISFILTGAIYGVAAVVFASQETTVQSISSTLGTVSTAFGSILPVFMGFYIGRFSTDAIGIILSSFTIGTLKYGLSIIAPQSSAGAITNIIYGIFLVIFFLISHQGQAILGWFKEKFGRKSTV